MVIIITSFDISTIIIVTLFLVGLGGVSGRSGVVGPLLAPASPDYLQLTRRGIVLDRTVDALGLDAEVVIAKGCRVCHRNEVVL